MFSILIYCLCFFMSLMLLIPFLSVSGRCLSRFHAIMARFSTNKVQIGYCCRSRSTLAVVFLVPHNCDQSFPLPLSPRSRWQLIKVASHTLRGVFSSLREVNPNEIGTDRRSLKGCSYRFLWTVLAMIKILIPISLD